MAHLTYALLFQRIKLLQKLLTLYQYGEETIYLDRFDSSVVSV